MLLPQTHLSLHVNKRALRIPFITSRAAFTACYSTDFNSLLEKKGCHTHINYKPVNIKAISSTSIGKFTIMKGVINIQSTLGSNVGFVANRVSDCLGQSFLLELVSSDLDSLGKEKETVKALAHYDGLDVASKLYNYRCEFEVPPEFGEIGAILIENKHHKEMYIKNIVFDEGNVTFTCKSWIHSKYDNPDKRIFFINKSYLPSKTPEGLKSLREKDLESLRGNGEGKRKSFDRVYDYDKYNDIGDPDTNSDLARPVLGGVIYSYPRRCRTGRKKTSIEPWSESRTRLLFYVPRDEQFSEIKQLTFTARTVSSLLHTALPTLDSMLVKDENKRFSSFMDIELLYNKTADDNLPRENGFLSALQRFFKAVACSMKSVLKFKTPRVVERDPFSWFRDEEFCRQMLAGLNPCSIKLVTEWPLMSKLDPEVYGPPESAITKEIVEQEIRGFMTLEEALERKKLFLLDYHDVLLPYVNEVRELEGTTLYGSRTLMFLTSSGTLRPLAIELTRPPNNGKPQWKHVYAPCWDATGVWLWNLAKVHVLAHDSLYHTLVSHWLRTHCASEPYIISTKRHLSQMHPVERLLCPHLRYTMQTNGLARQALIEAGGTIESCFSLGKFSMRFSSYAYAQQWRFDHEALPADLINRGMAVEDPTAPHGVKLTIEDYPFANDGLLLWDAIKQWATSYVNHYYPQANLVESDKELQAWWYEIRTVGHGDKKDEPWWPQLKNQDDLITIVSTIMWVTSCHHSAVNFGQYDYAGYFPNSPTTARIKMPNEDPTTEEWHAFLNNPKIVLLNCFPSKIQATKAMAIFDILSCHDPDEEYIGVNMEASWEAEPAIKVAFQEFNTKLQEIEGIIDSRNRDPNLRNRNGAGLMPYELLKPFSKPGMTGKGIPYSISV